MKRLRPSPGPGPRQPAGQQRAVAVFSIGIVDDGGDWSGIEGLEDLIQQAAGALAQHRQIEPQLPAAACLALSDDGAVRKLNVTYRAKDKPTNVLSFPARAHPGDADDAVPFIGDIILADQTVRRESLEQGIPHRHHIQHLVVHGLLHLLGYDHETERDATVMETIETEVLASLGIADPYCIIGTTEQTS